MDTIIRDDKLLQDKDERTSSFPKRLDALKMTEMTPKLNVVLLGKTGAGKSSTGNTILGRQAFIEEKSGKSVTRDVTVESGSFCELPITVYDTPGLFDTNMSDEEIQQMINEKVLQKCASGLCVFLLVIKADRFTEDDRKTVEKIEKMLGENNQKNIWILFTRGDELEEENTTIQEFIEETKELKTLVQKYKHRYHVFNKEEEEEGQSEQVKMLFTKILKPYLDIVAGEEILEPNALKRIIPEDIEPVSRVSGLPSRRIVLLGKTGVGKSAAGNTILGQKEFVSVMRMSSVTSECLEAQATVSGRSVSVVDTPGLLDTKMKPEELMMEIAKSVYVSSPGPHAFLIVFRINDRFTKHEQQIPQQIELMFGEEVLKYSIILFTHGDLLDGESVEKLIEENCKFRSLVQQCGGRYHVFNNKVNNREQVEDLLQKIDSMIQQNGGGHYSNQMYEDAQRYRQEEEEERKLQEEKQRQEEIERAIKQIEDRFRAEMEAEKLNAERQSEEEQRRREKQRREIEIAIKSKKTELRNRAENKSKLNEESGFSKFFSKYKHYLYMAGLVAGGIAIGTLVLFGFKAAAVAVAVVGAVVGVAAFKYDSKRKGEEKKRKQQEDKQMQEEIERVEMEFEEKFRAEMEAEKLKSERLSEEEQRRREKQRREELERVMKEIRTRPENTAPLASASSEQQNYRTK